MHSNSPRRCTPPPLPNPNAFADEQEVAEFKALVEAGLEAVSAPGWQVQVVGGQARHKAHHDAGKEGDLFSAGMRAACVLGPALDGTGRGPSGA